MDAKEVQELRIGMTNWNMLKNISFIIMLSLFISLVIDLVLVLWCLKFGTILYLFNGLFFSTVMLILAIEFTLVFCWSLIRVMDIGYTLGEHGIGELFYDPLLEEFVKVDEKETQETSLWSMIN